MNTVIDLFFLEGRDTSDAPIVRSKRDGVWVYRSWQEIVTAAERMAAGLIGRGIQHGDRVALLSHTREEWLVADLGVLMAGATTVPIYPSTLGADCLYVIGDSSCVAAIVEDAAQLEKLRASATDQTLPQTIVVIAGEAPEGSQTLEALQAEGGKALQADPELVRGRRELVSSDDLATIIYTSGTTGVPKGVMLTHENLVSQFQALNKATGFAGDDEQMVFLPLSHIFAKVFLYTALYIGIRCSFAENFERLGANLKETSPTFMAGVPRVYEKVSEKIRGRVATAPAWKQALFHWGIDVGSRYQAARAGGASPSVGLRLQQGIADRLIHAPIRAQLGGKIRFLVSGGGNLSTQVAELFEAVGLPLLNGYGLTETTAVTTANTPGHRKLGTVGTTLEGTELRLDTDGEVLVRGVGVTRGYLNNEEASAEAMAPGGWFRTGDIGVLDDEGFLDIVDRKKEIIVTAGGKNVAPQKVESLLKAQRAASNVLVYGDQRKFLVALVTIKEAVRRDAEHRRPGAAAAQLLRECVQADLDAVNAELPSWETIKKFHVLDQDWSEAEGELTPTQKLKRKVIIGKWLGVLNAMYADGPDLWSRDVAAVLEELGQLVQAGSTEDAVRLLEGYPGDLGPHLQERLAEATVEDTLSYARLLESAREFAIAAALHESLERPGRAGELYERAGRFDEAARCHEAAGKPLEAAIAYDRHGDIGAAIRTYQQAGERTLLADLYARGDYHAEAAELYAAMGQTARAIEMLKHVPTTDATSFALVDRLLDTLAGQELEADEAATLRTFLLECQADEATKATAGAKLETLAASGTTATLEAAAATDVDGAPDAGDASSYHWLKSIPLFAGLRLDDLRDLRRLAEETSYPAGEIIIEQGVAGPGLIVLLGGRAVVTDQRPDPAETLGHLGAGDFVGDMSLLDDQPTSARVAAESDVRALLLPKKHFAAFLGQHPDAALTIYKVFALTLSARLRASLVSA